MFSLFIRKTVRRSSLSNRRNSFRPFLEWLEERRLLADLTWIAPADPNNNPASWADAGNWNGNNQVPGANDRAIFNGNSTRTCALPGNVEVNSLIITGANTQITVPLNTTLTVSGASTSIGGGNISGQGSLIANSQSFSWSGGAIGVDTTVASGNVGITGDSTKTINGATGALHILSAASTWSGAGDIVINNGGGLKLEGPLSPAPRSTMTVTATGRMRSTSGVGTLTIRPNNTLEVQIGNLEISTNVENNGVISAGQGSVVLSGTTTSTGNGTVGAVDGKFSVGSGYQLSFSGSTTLNGSYISGPGTAVFGGDVTVNGTVNANNVLQLSGTVAGAGNINMLSSYTWYRGAWAGAGTMNVSGTLTIGAPVNGNDTLTMGRNLVNNGTIRWVAGNVLTQDAASLTNNQGSLFDMMSSGNNTWSRGTGATGTVSNATSTTFRKSSGAGNQWLQLPYDNLGVWNIQTGSFRMGLINANTAQYPVLGVSVPHNGNLTADINALLGGLPNGTSVTAAGGATNGTTTLNADGTITYTPNTGTVAASDTFTYTTTDSNGQTGTGTVLVTLTNQPPTANDISVSTSHNSPVTVNIAGSVSDPDGDNPTVTSVGSAANGTVVINSDGTITYTPNTGTTATSDTFTYTVSDGYGGTATANINVTLTNQPPVAPDLNFPVQLLTSTTLNLLAGASDPDGDPLTIAALGTPSAGTATLNANGTVTFTAPADWFQNNSYTIGSDGSITYSGTQTQYSATFTYTVSDGHGGFATGTVTVTPAADDGSSPQNAIAVTDGLYFLDLPKNTTIWFLYTAPSGTDHNRVDIAVGADHEAQSFLFYIGTGSNVQLVWGIPYGTAQPLPPDQIYVGVVMSYLDRSSIQFYSYYFAPYEG